MIVNVIVTQHHRRPSTQISHKPVVLGYIVGGSGFFLVSFVGGCRWFSVVFAGFVGGFGWFSVLVTTYLLMVSTTLQKYVSITFKIFRFPALSSVNI